MSRGSGPGERRGGRQRGTPNKKTALKLAAMDAAAAGASPLEFLLRLMRNCNVPVADRLNAAAEAAQYVHARPRQQTLDPNVLVRVVEDGPNGLGRGAVTQFIKLLVKGDTNAEAPEVREGCLELSPLEFMLEVMQDPKVAPKLRFKAVKLAARYSHAKLPASADNDKRAVLDNRYGFKVPPEVVVIFGGPSEGVDQFGREIDWASSLRRWKAGEPPVAQSFGPTADMELPDGYGYEEYKIAEDLLKKIETKRRTQALVPAEHFAQAHLRVRRAIYQREREKAQPRIEELEEKLSKCLDPDMQRERNYLRRRFPDPLDDNPMGKSIRAWRLQSLEK